MNHNFKTKKKPNISSETKSQSFDWLMRNNKATAYYIAKNFPISKLNKSKSQNKYIKFAIDYQDETLLKIALKKGEDINKEHVHSNIHDNSSMYYSYSESIDSLQLGIQSKLNNVEKFSFEDKKEIEEGSNKLPIIFNNKQIFFSEALNNKIEYYLDYNFNFIENLFKNGFIISREKEAKENLLKTCINKLSAVMKDKLWEEKNDHNIEQTKILWNILKNNGLNINNNELLNLTPSIVNKFTHIKQWHIFNFLFEKDFLLEKNTNGDNFLHYLISYLNYASDKLLENQIKSSSVVWNSNKSINSHVMLVGTTGRGKSSTLKSMIANLQSQGKNVIVIDSEKEVEIKDISKEWEDRSVLSTNVHEYFINFWDSLSSNEYFKQALLQKNKQNKTPLELAENDLALLIKTKHHSNELNKKLKSKNKSTVSTNKI